MKLMIGLGVNSITDMEYNKEFIKEFDELCKKYSFGFDDALNEFAHAVEEDRYKQNIPEVISLLDTTIEELRQAAFNIYASHK